MAHYFCRCLYSIVHDQYTRSACELSRLLGFYPGVCAVSSSASASLSLVLLRFDYLLEFLFNCMAVGNESLFRCNHANGHFELQLRRDTEKRHATIPMVGICGMDQEYYVLCWYIVIPEAPLNTLACVIQFSIGADTVP
jgi:hypothetical protein